jgi:TusA-related sulfurtransferase
MFGWLFGKKKQVSKAEAAVAQTDSSKTNRVLDCANLNCPMPIVKISGEFRTMNAGETLEVSATDPAFKADLEAWVRKTGNELVSFKEGSLKVAIVRKN